MQNLCVASELVADRFVARNIRIAYGKSVDTNLTSPLSLGETAPAFRIRRGGRSGERPSRGSV
jgi:hypothetical protein